MSHECERLLMAMPQTALDALRHTFRSENVNDGLPIERFIPSVKDVLPKDLQDDPSLLRDLKELFAQIDVDGSGEVSWQEFSDFCVQAGFVASEGEMIKAASTQYSQRASYMDRELRLPNVESMMTFVIAGMQLLAVCDARYPKLRLYLIRPPVESKPDDDGDDGDDGDDDNSDDGDDGDDSDLKGNEGNQKQKDGNKSEKHRKTVHIATDEDVLARNSTSASGNVFLLGELHGTAPKDYIERKRGAKVINEGGFLSSVWMPCFNMIACSRSALCISFWNIHALHEKPPRFDPTFKASINTLGPQHCLAWHDSSKSLFAAGDRSLRITRYAVSVETIGQRKLHAVQVASYVAHSGVITQLLVLDDFEKENHHQLASSGMDGFVHFFWLNGTRQNRYNSSRPPLVPGTLPFERRGGHGGHDVFKVCRSRVKAHETGVRQMCTGGTKGLLLTCSFDFSVFGWNYMGVTEQPLFTINCGRTPLLGVVSVPNSGYATSVNIEGGCFRWDLHRVQNVAGDDGLVDQFLPVDSTANVVDVPSNNKSESCCKPTSVALCTGGSLLGTIVMGGRKLFLFDLVTKTQAESDVVDLVYNDVNLTILGAAGRNVKCWDAMTGVLRQEFVELTPKNITTLLLDGRQRKFIVGDSSGVLKCFNVLNGAFMGSILLEPHQKAVSALAYSTVDRLLFSAR